MAPLIVESWIWYGVVTLMFFFRGTARLLLFRDIRKLQIEDWFMLVVFCLYTVLIVFLNICADVSTNLIDPADVASLTPQDIRDRVWGSKCVLVVESMMCSVQWGTKVCLLVLYYRLTENLRQRIVVQIAAGYSAVTFIVMMSLYYGYWCRPFKAFWETPTPNIQCATQTHHLIVNLTFNLTSDLMIIFIPLPMFIKAHLETKKKLLLIFPFSLGFFTIVCAILSKHLSFTQPFSAEWLYWYTREASTAMIVANMPYSWAIIRKVFHVKAFLRPGGSQTNDGVSMTDRRISEGTVPRTSRAEGSFAKPSTGRKLSAFNPFSKNDGAELQTYTTNQPAAFPSGLNALDWKRGQGVDGKDEPLSTSSSEDSTGKSIRSAGPRAQPVSDVDRLYQIDDDDDLEITGSHHPAQRQYEP